ncbi:TPA: hypothetical protein VAP34_002078 [Streptococcus agalactiae]|nr:hypothetical protein [Streptococcus agalactiae]
MSQFVSEGWMFFVKVHIIKAERFRLSDVHFEKWHGDCKTNNVEVSGA